MCQDQIIDVEEKQVVSISKNKKHYTIDIYGGIASYRWCYQKLINTLRDATEKNIITIYINSSGGDGEVAGSIRCAIAKSRATITGVVNGQCFSAAADIFFSCPKLSIEETASFVFHTSSRDTGLSPDATDLIYRKMHLDNDILLAQKLYGRYLTREEFKIMTKYGVDICLTGREMIKRIKKVSPERLID